MAALQLNRVGLVGERRRWWEVRRRLNERGRIRRARLGKYFADVGDEDGSEERVWLWCRERHPFPVEMQKPVSEVVVVAAAGLRW